MFPNYNGYLDEYFQGTGYGERLLNGPRKFMEEVNKKIIMPEPLCKVG